MSCKSTLLDRLKRMEENTGTESASLKDEKVTITVTESQLYGEIGRLIKEAVLAQERHTDLSGIRNTVEGASAIVTASVSKVATTLVTRLLLAIGAACVWFTLFLFNMRDDTIELKRSMVDVNSQIQEIASNLKTTAEATRKNAEAIREIIVRHEEEHKHSGTQPPIH